jgi:hypothetical protein
MMGNQSKNNKNQMPTGEGKKQSPRLGESMEMNERSEVMQAQRFRADLNTGTYEDREPAERSGRVRNPKRPKAGR